MNLHPQTPASILEPTSTPPTKKRSKTTHPPPSPSLPTFSQISVLHLQELWSLWASDTRIPTHSSRREWSLARNLNPIKVNSWWARRKGRAKRAGIALPKGTYELPVGTPPVIGEVETRPRNSQISYLHLDELWSLWALDTRIPTASSRREWSLARNLNPVNVNRWWDRRKARAKKAGIALPEGTYELPVGMPPVIEEVREAGSSEWPRKMIKTDKGHNLNSNPTVRSRSPSTTNDTLSYPTPSSSPFTTTPGPSSPSTTNDTLSYPSPSSPSPSHFTTTSGPSSPSTTDNTLSYPSPSSSRGPSSPSSSNTAFSLPPPPLSKRAFSELSQTCTCPHFEHDDDVSPPPAADIDIQRPPSSNRTTMTPPTRPSSVSIPASPRANSTSPTDNSKNLRSTPVPDPDQETLQMFELHSTYPSYFPGSPSDSHQHTYIPFPRPTDSDSLNLIQLSAIPFLSRSPDFFQCPAVNSNPNSTWHLDGSTYSPDGSCLSPTTPDETHQIDAHPNQSNELESGSGSASASTTDVGVQKPYTRYALAGRPDGECFGYLLPVIDHDEDATLRTNASATGTVPDDGDTWDVKDLMNEGPNK